MSGPLRNPASLLVIAPHPDDETIGGFTLMRRLRARGVTVKVLVASDGSASHPSSVRWPRRRLIMERRRETRRVLAGIGIPASDVTFLALPDGRLHTQVTAIRQGLERAMHVLPSPAVALGPSEIDHHADHRAVATAMSMTRVPGVTRCSYLVWPSGKALRGARALCLTSQERLAKRHALYRYRTQVGAITDDPNGFMMTRRQIGAFTRPQEWHAPWHG